MKAISIGLMALVTFAFLSIFFGSWYTVSQGERGVVTHFGAVVGTAEPGLGFKMPFVTGITKVSVQTNIVKLPKEEAYSQDQQAAIMQLSVNYSVVPGDVTQVYSQFGGLDGLEARLILPRVRQQVKNVFGHYTAATAISQRDKLNSEIKQAVQDEVKAYVQIEGVQLEDIKFSKDYEAAVEARMMAEVEVQKSMQRVTNEAQLAKITTTKAQAEADSNLSRAKAAAEAVRIQGAAEADAIRARGAALKDNPALVSLTTAERWDGKLPISMVPEGAVPFINVNKGQ